MDRTPHTARQADTNSQNLSDISAEHGIVYPCGYQHLRHQITPGIVHFGGGKFSFATLGEFQHQKGLAALHSPEEWAEAAQNGICMVSSSDASRDRIQKFREAGSRYYCITLEPGNCRADEIGFVTDYLHTGDDWTTVLERVARAQLVTTTLTEKSHDDPRLAVFQSMITALKFRLMTGNQEPLYIASFDNMRRNSLRLQNTLLAAAELMEEMEIRAALEDPGTFIFVPTKVDCIVTSPTPESIELIKRIFQDQIPSDVPWIVRERYARFVTQEELPPLRGLSQVTKGPVEEWQVRKLEVLNLTHTIVCPVGMVLGCESIDQVMNSLPVRRFMEALMKKEVVPHLPYIPGEDPVEFMHTTFDRFSNNLISDHPCRPATDFANKLRERGLRVLQECPDPELLAVGVAANLHYISCACNEAGRGYEPSPSPHLEEFQTWLAEEEQGLRDNAVELILDTIFEHDPALKDKDFYGRVRDALASFRGVGVCATLDNYVGRLAGRPDLDSWTATDPSWGGEEDLQSAC